MATPDLTTGAFVVSCITAGALLLDKLIAAVNGRNSAKVQQQQVAVSATTAQVTAVKTEADIEINWRHEANTLQKELHAVRDDMAGLKREFKNLQLDFDVVTGKLTACQRENLLLRETATDATDARDKWRLSAKSWLQVVEDQGRDPEYRRTADRLYIEAMNADDVTKARELARATALEKREGE